MGLIWEIVWWCLYFVCATLFCVFLIKIILDGIIRERDGVSYSPKHERKR